MQKLLLTLISLFTILFTNGQCQADFQYTSSGFNLNLISTSINAGNTLNSQTPTWDFWRFSKVYPRIEGPGFPKSDGSCPIGPFG